jgi:hypothetical protein
MLTWSKPNAIVPDKPLRWILATLGFYGTVASIGIVLAFAVISIPAFVHWVYWVFYCEFCQNSPDF